MAKFDRSHWMAAANIAQFEERLKRETGTCERKMLEALILLEQKKLGPIKPAEDR